MSVDTKERIVSLLMESFHKHAQETSGYFHQWPNGLVAIDLEDFDLRKIAEIIRDELSKD